MIKQNIRNASSFDDMVEILRKSNLSYIKKRNDRRYLVCANATEDISTCGESDLLVVGDGFIASSDDSFVSMNSYINSGDKFNYRTLEKDIGYVNDLKANIDCQYLIIESKHRSNYFVTYDLISVIDSVTGNVMFRREKRSLEQIYPLNNICAIKNENTFSVLRLSESNKMIVKDATIGRKCRNTRFAGNIHKKDILLIGSYPDTCIFDITKERTVHTYHESTDGYSHSENIGFLSNNIFVAYAYQTMGIFDLRCKKQISNLKLEGDFNVLFSKCDANSFDKVIVLDYVNMSRIKSDRSNKSEFEFVGELQWFDLKMKKIQTIEIPNQCGFIDQFISFSC